MLGAIMARRAVHSKREAYIVNASWSK